MVYQENQHVIRLSPMLRSFIKGRRWLEVYDNLLVIEGEMDTGTHYPSLHIVEEFPDIFLEELLGLPPNRERDFVLTLFLQCNLFLSCLTEWHRQS